MASFSTVFGVLALIIIGLVVLRRRIAKGWITPDDVNKHAVKLSKEDVVVITGGNTGLGFQTALDLAQRGATIVLACRDSVSGGRAANWIRVCTRNDNVEYIYCDLASLKSVRAFAGALKTKHKNVYALICNAGVWVPMEQKHHTDDGYEIHFGVNHLSHLLLIQLLLPNMKQTGNGSRVVLVSSSLLKNGLIDMETKDFVHQGRIAKKKSFAPTGYCDSKLMNALTCRQLAKELAVSNTTTVVVCPGFCKTDLGRNVKTSMLMAQLMKMFQRSAIQGAQNIIFAAVQDSRQLTSGEMYKDGKVAEEETQRVLEMAAQQQKFWELSMELIREGGDRLYT